MENTLYPGLERRRIVATVLAFTSLALIVINYAINMIRYMRYPDYMSDFTAWLQLVIAVGTPALVVAFLLKPHSEAAGKVCIPGALILCTVRALLSVISVLEVFEYLYYDTEILIYAVLTAIYAVCMICFGICAVLLLTGRTRRVTIPLLIAAIIEIIFYFFAIVGVASIGDIETILSYLLIFLHVAFLYGSIYLLCRNSKADRAARQDVSIQDAADALQALNVQLAEGAITQAEYQIRRDEIRRQL